MITENIPKKKLQLNNTYHQFKLIDTGIVESVKSRYYLFEHKTTKMPLFYLHNNDDNKLFGIGFKTTPDNNTGVAHILEHSVLGGSQKFSVKDPFNEMAKGSMATFINAMTWPDKTIYPVSSQIEKDFYNLMDVYLDAVFFPRLTKETFAQEGCHLEFSQLNNSSSDLIYKGIVYNEMKGVYSNLSSILNEFGFRKLFTENIYQYNSGGDPKKIPSLTYKKFLQFHKEYYHPSNARIFLSGDQNILKSLEFIEKNYLSRFNKKTKKITIAKQKKWKSEKKITVPYPAQNLITDKYAFINSFATNSVLNSIETMSLFIIEEILLGNSASILRKTLIDSKLGETLSSNSGYMSEIRDTIFSIGMQGIQKKNIQKVKKLINKTLVTINEKGFTKADIDRAFHQIEFQNSELSSSGGHYDINLMIITFEAWLYNGNPTLYLDIKKQLEEIKKRYKQDENYFIKLFRKYFIKNNHKIAITFVPDVDYVKKNELDEKEKLKNIKKKLTVEQKEEIIQYSQKLLELQKAPNSKKDLETLPSIELKDITKKALTIPLDVRSLHKHIFLSNKIFTNNIIYIKVFFDISYLSEKEFSMLPFFLQVLNGHGIDSTQYNFNRKAFKNYFNKDKIQYSYNDFANLKSSTTGGIGAGFYLSKKYIDDTNNTSAITSSKSKNKKNKFKAGIVFEAKTLLKDIKKTIRLISYMIAFIDLKDNKRFTDLLLQKKAKLNSNLVPAGLTYAASLSSSLFNKQQKISEIYSGLSALHFLNTFNENEYNFILLELATLKKKIFNTENLTFQITSEKKHYSKAKKTIDEEFIKFFTATEEISFQKKVDNVNLSKFSLLSKDIKLQKNTKKYDDPFIGIALESPVSYATMSFQTYDYTSKNAALLFFLQNFLGSGFLNEKIRIQGGAYGGFARYKIHDGIFYFASYRDPNIIHSVKTFYEAIDYLKTEKFDKDEIKQALIGSFSNLDGPLSPEKASSISFNRYINNITNEQRQIFRDNLFSLTAEKIQKNLPKLAEKIDKKIFSILSSEKNLLELKTKNKIKSFKIITM